MIISPIRVLVVSVLVSAVVALAGSDEIHASPGECTRLSGPPEYGPKALATTGGPGPFCLPGEAGEEECLFVRIDGEERWWLEKLVAPGSNQLRFVTVAEIESHEEARIGEILQGDLDGDGKKDLLIHWSIRWDTPYLDLYLGRGEGAYGYEATIWQDGVNIYDPAVGDFDGDHVDELVFARSDDRHAVEAYKFDPVEGLVLWRKLFDFEPSSFAAMDVNGDEIDDLVYLTRFANYPFLVTRFGETNQPLYLRQTQRAPFRSHAIEGVVAGGSGRAEVAIMSRYDSIPRIAAHGLTRQLWGWEPTWTTVMTDGQASEYTRIDANGDGVRDFVFENDPFYVPYGGGFQIMYSSPGRPLQQGPRSFNKPRLIAARDLDGDGLRDAWVVEPGGTISSYRGQADGGFDEGWISWDSGTRYSRHRASGDLDDDGFEDLVLGLENYSGVEWLRALGDGTYERLTLDPLPGTAGEIEILDLNGDDSLDIAVLAFVHEISKWVLFVAWGEDGKNPGTWHPVLSGYLHSERAFVDLDGDGDLDLLSRDIRPGGWRSGSDLSSFVLEEGHYRLVDQHYMAPFLGGGWNARLVGGDVDGDGLPDAVHWGQDSEDRDRAYLVWRQNLGGGVLGDPAPIYPRSIQRFSQLELIGTDVDRDGDLDIILRGGCNREGSSITVLGNDHGVLKSFWRGPDSNDCPSVVFSDVDSDGLLDAVESARRGSFRVWRADGSGGFEPALGPFFVAYADATGIALTASLGGKGQDHLRFEDSHGGPHKTVTLPQLTSTAAEDLESPRTELLLVPDLDFYAEIQESENRWRISGKVDDDCVVASVTRASVRTPILSPEDPSHYLPSPQTEIRLYESPDGEGREVVLTGPDEVAVRSLFAGIVTDARLDLEPHGYVEIHTHDEWGPRPRIFGDDQVMLPEARATHRWFFVGNRLDKVTVRRPRADISFEVEATDQVGKTAIDVGTYREQLNRYCEGEADPPILCD